MISDDNRKELNQKGYTVVHDVVTPAECNRAVHEYQQWLSQFKTFPRSYNSIISRYNTGHMTTTWRLRLQTRPVFAELWKTDKLLTSFDAIGIGRPPEEGEESFQVPDKYWLHSDQTRSRFGLHAYQGALYLEEQCHDDWTFQVMEGSHKLLDEYYQKNPKRESRTKYADYFKLSESDVNYFKRAGCSITRVPVSKGGMVIWDARLIHANARPLQSRENPGRWRYTVFVSMTPAVWATPEDIAEHARAFDKAMMTNHWSSQRIQTFTSSCPRKMSCPDRVPEVGKTEVALRLSGVLPYDFDDGESNGPDFVPEFRDSEENQ